jgi:hypothetical protein
MMAAIELASERVGEPADEDAAARQVNAHKHASDMMFSRVTS